MACESAICVGKKPFLSIEAITDLIGFLPDSAAFAISSAFTSVFNPERLCFKKSELNKPT